MLATQEITSKQDKTILNSTNVDNVDNMGDNFKLESENVDKSAGYTIRIPADAEMLNQIEEYLKFVEIPYEVMK